MIDLRLVNGIEHVVLLKQTMSGYETQRFVLTFNDKIPFAKTTAEAFVRGYREGRRDFGEVINADTLDRLEIMANKEMLDIILRGPIAATLSSIKHVPRI